MRLALLCVTGLDGAGKSTLIRAVRAELARRAAAGVATVSVWDTVARAGLLRPGGDGAPALDAYLTRLDPTSGLLLVLHGLHAALARAQAAGAALQLVDGYWYKYGAMAIAGGARRADVLRLGRLFPAPRWLFHLQVDPTVAARRKRTLSGYETGFAAARTPAAFVAFQRRTAGALGRLLRGRRVIPLDGAAPVAANAARVVATIAGAGWCGASSRRRA